MLIPQDWQRRFAVKMPPIRVKSFRDGIDGIPSLIGSCWWRDAEHNAAKSLEPRRDIARVVKARFIVVGPYDYGLAGERTPMFLPKMLVV
jgi:hypothetical protein